MCLSLLYLLDLFKSPIFFYFNGKKKIFSYFGGFFSLILYGYMFFAFLNSDVFQKNEPIVVKQTSQNIHAKNIYFSSNKTLIFGVHDQLAQLHYEPKIFRYIAQFTTFYNNMSKTVKKEIKRCNYTGNRITVNVFNAFCLEENEFYLSGSVDDGYMSYLSILVAPCDNKTNNNTCKTNDEINEFFDNQSSQKYFSVRYSNAVIKFNNYEQPFESNTDVLRSILDRETGRNLDLYYNNVYLDTDDGWFFSSKKNSREIMLNKQYNDFRLRKNPSDPFFQLNLFASKEEISISRRYKKLPEVLAELSGIAHFIIITTGLFIKIITYINTLKMVINDLYMIPKIKSEPKAILKGNIRKRKNSSLSGDRNNPFSKQNIENLQNSKLINSQQQTIEILKNQNEPFIEKKIIVIQSKDNSDSFSASNFNKKHQGKESFKLNPKILKDDSIILDHYSPEKKEEIPNKIIHQITNKSIIQTKINYSNNNVEKISKSSSLSVRRNEIIKNINHQLFQENKANKLKLNIFVYVRHLWNKFMKFIFKRELPPISLIISQAEEKYKSDMDTITILRKHHDLEKLKLLVLNEDQLILFNYLSKPFLLPLNEKVVGLDEIGDSCKKITTLINQSKERKTNIEAAFQRVYEDKENIISKRLINLLDFETKGEIINR